MVPEKDLDELIKPFNQPEPRQYGFWTKTRGLKAWKRWFELRKSNPSKGVAGDPLFLGRLSHYMVTDTQKGSQPDWGSWADTRPPL